jgi:hypothetical protein
MAEAVAIGGFAVSIIGLAAEGIKIAETITAFVDKIRNAPEEVMMLARDVKSTSNTLQEVGDTLKFESVGKLASADWYQDTKEHIATCAKVFDEVQQWLRKSRAANAGADGINFGKRDRLKWALNPGRMSRLRASLERLKADFMFKLAVLGHIRAKINQENARQQQAMSRKLGDLEFERQCLSLKIAYIKKVGKEGKGGTLVDIATNETLLGASKPSLDADISKHKKGSAYAHKEPTDEYPTAPNSSEASEASDSYDTHDGESQISDDADVSPRARSTRRDKSAGPGIPQRRPRVRSSSKAFHKPPRRLRKHAGSLATALMTVLESRSGPEIPTAESRTKNELAKTLNEMKLCLERLSNVTHEPRLDDQQLSLSSIEATLAKVSENLELLRKTLGGRVFETSTNSGGLTTVVMDQTVDTKKDEPLAQGAIIGTGQPHTEVDRQPIVVGLAEPVPRTQFNSTGLGDYCEPIRSIGSSPDLEQNVFVSDTEVPSRIDIKKHSISRAKTVETGSLSKQPQIREASSNQSRTGHNNLANHHKIGPQPFEQTSSQQHQSLDGELPVDSAAPDVASLPDALSPLPAAPKASNMKSSWGTRVRERLRLWKPHGRRRSSYVQSTSADPCLPPFTLLLVLYQSHGGGV